MRRSHTPGERIVVWVIIKSGSKVVDSIPHLIKTHVTNGYNCWFDRTVATAVCGVKRAGNAGWRTVPKPLRTKDGPPKEYCEACFRLNIMRELAE